MKHCGDEKGQWFNGPVCTSKKYDPAVLLLQLEKFIKMNSRHIVRKKYRNVEMLANCANKLELNQFYLYSFNQMKLLALTDSISLDISSFKKKLMSFLFQYPPLAPRSSVYLDERSRNTCFQTKVIIVGAGISGLAAAYTLNKAGITDLVILEAQSEPGGRIKSCEFNGNSIEIGAQWVHGSRSRFYDFVSSYDMLLPTHSYEGQGVYLRKDGRQVDNELIEEIRQIVADILVQCESFFKRNVYTTRSIGEYLKIKFHQYLEESCKHDSEEVLKLKREIFDWHVRFQIVDNSCRSLDDLSCFDWGRFRSCGDGNFSFKTNYSTVVETIVGELPCRSIKLNRSVNLIEWRNGVMVVCQVNNGHQEYYCADHVIVTCSVGVLNSMKYSLFSPKLPDLYLKAFNSFGFGTICKIFLYYETRWWNDIQGIQLVWDTINECLLDENEQQEMCWTRGITGFDLVEGSSRMLLVWVGGVGAELVETMSDELVAKHCTTLLSKFFVDREVPEPQEIIRSKWKSNRHICGSYSYYRVSNQHIVKNIPQQLLKPIHSEKSGRKIPTIMFAGEALHERHYSTVHGAFETGVTQAEKLINFISSSSS